jgi:plasmid maintenance system antidote protein VapI
MTKLKNIHPGEILKEEFLIPMGITAYRLSKIHWHSTNKNKSDHKREKRNNC